jgi:hypothetical protein
MRARRGSSLTVTSIALAGAGVAIAALAACNMVLGIEEGHSRPVDLEAALPDAELVDAATPLAPSRCALDTDCVPPNPCYTAHCDTVVGACAYALCEAPRACAMATCNPNGFTCEDTVDYGFRTTRYGVPDVTLGCASPNDCVAAAFPFLFVGTKSGSAVALVVDDRIAKAARTVPIRALSLAPARIVTSGRRVWFVGDVQGSAPPYRLPLAYLDVPSDPTARELVATTLTVGYPYPTVSAFPAPDGALFAVFDDPSQGFPTAVLAPPFPEQPALGLANPEAADAGPAPPSGNVPMYRIAAPPAGASVVAASGARLVVYRTGLVSLVGAAGSAGAAAGAEMAINPALPALAPPLFFQGADGTVVATASIVADPPPPDCDCTSHARLQWIFPNGFSPTADIGQIVDAEIHENPNAPAPNVTCHACALSYFSAPSLAAWIDPHTALVAAAATDPQRALTAVRSITRDPIAAPVSRRAVTAANETPKGNFATDRIALASAHGLGYLVVADGEGNGVTLSIFDPACDAK